MEQTGTMERAMGGGLFEYPVNQKLHDERTLGQRAADNFTNAFGTWTYVISQTAVILVWMFLNAVGFFVWKWDTYPFILLNLAFSAQASYAAPLILMVFEKTGPGGRARCRPESGSD